MIIYNIITAICFAFLTLFSLYIFLNLILKSRMDRISFIHKFKRGNFIAILLISIPLYFIGYIYSGGSILDSILASISNVLDCSFFKINNGNVSALIDNNQFYRITISYCSILISLNTCLFVLSFTAQYLWQFYSKIAKLFTKKEKLLIFGNNNNSISIYQSAKEFNSCLIDNISSFDGFELYRKKARYISSDICCINDTFKNKQKNHFLSNNVDDLVKRIVKRALKKKYTIVINCENDEKNIYLCKLFVEKIEELKDVPKTIFEKLLKNAQKEIAKSDHKLTEEEIQALHQKVIQETLLNHLRVYVFGDPKYESLYGNLIESSMGCIRYKNKYQMLAMDFINKYPITKFMDKRHIDYSTTLVNPEVEINVCMMGFRKLNYEIFLTSVATSQFLTKTKEGIQSKLVNYHFFDKTKTENYKSLDHLYYRYKKGFNKVKTQNYLPLPSFPANENLHHFDSNSIDCYTDLRDIVTRSKKDVNLIIISFGNSLENITIAEKIIEKRKEWKTENIIIFVHVEKSYINHLIFREKSVIPIGVESECVYNIDCIAKNKIFKMAQMRNEIYDLEYKITNEKGFKLNENSILENKNNANKNWFIEKSQMERESNLYCCLSLESKLNLMGLEYIEDDGLSKFDEEDYINEYATNDLPDLNSYNLKVNGKRIVKYTLNFPDSKRKNLAIIEHCRWNAFMISKGFVPASKEQILNEKLEKNGKLKYSNGKNNQMRRHGNLTTFEGLIDFRKMIAQRNNCDEVECDVIKYDYQLLDDAYWLLSQNGYKIIKRSH